MAHKPQVVVYNKIDIPEVRERWGRIEPLIIAQGYFPFAISGISGENVRQVLYKAGQLLAETPVYDKGKEIPVYRPEADPRHFSIEKVPHGWRVHGAAVERAAAMTYWNNDASIRRFQRILETLDIDKALREAGVAEGDIVYIGEYELEWSD